MMLATLNKGEPLLILLGAIFAAMVLASIFWGNRRR